MSWEFLCGIFLFEAHTESGTIAQWHSPAVVVYLVLMTPNWAAAVGELRLGKCWGTVKKSLHPIFIVMCLWWLRFLHCSPDPEVGHEDDLP